MNPTSDREVVARLCAWFARAARPLPWRPARPGAARDPYRALVSEIMLQQTQAARVAERFDAFLERFPSVRHLARADEHDVLAAWSGLGYYRRARSLHRAAQAIVGEHGGRVPDDPDALRRLPGVGDYTAGAIASIVFGRAEPAVDGNVTRVLLRLAARPGRLGAPADLRWARDRAGALAEEARRQRDVARGPARSRVGPGPLNEALMELGATLCVPRSPACARCPLEGLCLARARGAAGRIPAPRTPGARRTLHAASVLVRDAQDRLLVERRPDAGLWRRLWQAPTLESPDAEPDALGVARWLGVRRARVIDRFAIATTHRDVRFTVYDAGRAGEALSRRLLGAGGERSSRCWLEPARVADLPLSSPARRVLLRTPARP